MLQFFDVGLWVRIAELAVCFPFANALWIVLCMGVCARARWHEREIGDGGGQQTNVFVCGV